MHTIGVYGTLKKGGWNHTRWGMGHAKYLGSTDIIGAMDLHQFGYPRLYAVGDAPQEYERSHVLEVYEIDDQTFQSIESMELGAGYYVQEVKLNDGEDIVKVFLMNPEYPFASDRFIESFTV